MSSTTSTIEFGVQMSCESCVEAVRNSLKNVYGINHIDIQLKNNTVLVESLLPVSEVLELLESTGRKVVVKGAAGSLAGVAVIECRDIQGVIRFMQIDENTCIIDGTVDGMKCMPHSVCVHECGDLSDGCENVGSLFQPRSSLDEQPGVLGSVTPSENGRATFRFIKSNIHLSDIIGRSVVLTSLKNGTSDKKLACGIIARSAGLFQNAKTICACDGTSIWDDISKPKL